ncbi:hypothetical protein Clacol_000878 [Clathrus columnatus]|uniref:Uncharacterized protein n=1 Tax=Clathrus columnatus TaxID=1419009 RepID=A0AAV5A0F2_9AGAM|nr:hypothetical protein Clacol_000878 [Clathrus columnatus]
MPSKSQRLGRKLRNKGRPSGPVYGDEHSLFIQNPFISSPRTMPVLPYTWYLNGQNLGSPNPWHPGFAPNGGGCFYKPGEENTSLPIRPLQTTSVPYYHPSRHLPPVFRVANSSQALSSSSGYDMGPYGSQIPLSTFQPSSSPSQDSVHSQMASGSSSDIERLRKLKETILSGQHPFFKAVPNPDALAKLYLGPHPTSSSSQVYNGLPSPEHQQHHQQQQIYKEEPVEETSNSQVSFKGPNTDLRLVSEKTAVSASTSSILANANVSESPSQSVAIITHPEALKNGHVEENVPPITSTSIQESESFASVVHLPKDGSSHVHSPPASIQGETMDKPQAPTIQDPKPPLVMSPRDYEIDRDRDRDRERERERDREKEKERERSEYPAPGPEHPSRSDSYKYSQYSSDRRGDNGRYSSRHPDSTYDRDHHRHWDRDRDRRPFDRYAYERPRRQSFAERRMSSASSFSNNIETQKLEPVEDRNLRSEVPPHPEQWPVPELMPRLDQRLPDENLSRSTEQRHRLPVPESQRERASLVSQHPEQRREVLPYSSSAEQRPRELPYGEPTKRPLDTFHGRRAPLPYTDLHPPHSDLASLDTETTGPSLRPSQPSSDPSRPIISVPDQRPASRIPETQNQYPKSSAEQVSSRLYNENSQREPYREQKPPAASPITSERTEKVYASHASTIGGRSTAAAPVSAYDMKSVNSETNLADTQPRPGPVAGQYLPSDRNSVQPPVTGPESRASVEPRSADPRQQVPIHEQNIRREPRSSMDDRDGRKYYAKRSPSPPRRPVADKVDVHRDHRSHMTTASSFRDGPPLQSRSYSADRRSLDTGSQRPPTHHYPSPPPPPPLHPQSRPPPIGDRREINRREETRQWRERSENYPPFDSQVEPERGGRRFPDTHGPPRGRPPPPPPHPHPPSAPASWDRDKDKEYEPWLKYPPRGSPPPLGSGPPRWEEPPPTHPPPSHRPLQARLGDNFDDRFIPRDAVVDRGRYRPGLTPPSADVPIRGGGDTYRENNPRLRPRSPSPMNRPVPGATSYDGGHRPTKRSRDEYDMPPRSGSYYDDTRRGGENDPYANRMPPPPPYYDHRPGHGPGPGPSPSINPREPPYSRDRGPDPYVRRDVPLSRSPPFYPPPRSPPRDRYPPPPR